MYYCINLVENTDLGVTEEFTGQVEAFIFFLW